jgi:hypothetical protein
MTQADLLLFDDLLKLKMYPPSTPALKNTGREHKRNSRLVLSHESRVRGAAGLRPHPPLAIGVALGICQSGLSQGPGLHAVVRTCWAMVL